MRGLLEVSVRPLDAYGDGLSETEMDWDSTLLYNKAKLYAERAHSEPVESALFALWMSLALELLARAALSRIHPVLLADPREQDPIHYVFWGGADEHPELVRLEVWEQRTGSREGLDVSQKAFND